MFLSWGARAPQARAALSDTFYLMISLGGAIGSALVGLVAPLVLPRISSSLSDSSSARLLLFQAARVHPVLRC